jgi:hypothetical protein
MSLSSSPSTLLALLFAVGLFAMNASTTASECPHSHTMHRCSHLPMGRRRDFLPLPRLLPYGALHIHVSIHEAPFVW